MQLIAMPSTQMASVPLVCLIFISLPIILHTAATCWGRKVAVHFRHVHTFCATVRCGSVMRLCPASCRWLTSANVINVITPSPLEMGLENCVWKCSKLQPTTKPATGHGGDTFVSIITEYKPRPRHVRVWRWQLKVIVMLSDSAALSTEPPSVASRQTRQIRAADQRCCHQRWGEDLPFSRVHLWSVMFGLIINSCIPHSGVIIMCR